MIQPLWGGLRTEQATCWVTTERLTLLATVQCVPQKGSRPPSEAWGRALVSVMIITIDNYHNNRIFHKNTSSPTDYFASCSSVPSGGGTMLPVSGCAWGRRCSRREMLLLLPVLLAESIAQLLHFFFFPFFFFYTIFFFKALMFIGEMSKMCPSVRGLGNPGPLPFLTCCLSPAVMSGGWASRPLKDGASSGRNERDGYELDPSLHFSCGVGLGLG